MKIKKVLYYEFLIFSWGAVVGAIVSALMSGSY